jgi:hypothetical protein
MSNTFQEIRLADRRIIPTIITAFLTEHGHRISFRDAVLTAWYIDYLTRHPNAETTGKTRVLSMRDGILRDRALLERANIKGLPTAEGKSSIRPWDESLKRLDRFLLNYQ